MLQLKNVFSFLGTTYYPLLIQFLTATFDFISLKSKVILLVSVQFLLYCTKN